MGMTSEDCKTTSTQLTGEKGKTTRELRLDMCWLKPFFLPSQNARADILKKSSDVRISHNFKLFLFVILQQCHECPVMASCPKKSKISAFCIVSMRFVFPFLMFFVLLPTGTFNTEPLLVLRGFGGDPDTRPEHTEEERRGFRQEKRSHSYNCR